MTRPHDDQQPTSASENPREPSEARQSPPGTATPDLPSTPFERRVDARLLLSVLATGLMSFGGVLVETALNVAFPTLMREFSIGTSTVQWIVTGYLLVLSVMLPVSSLLKRRFTTMSLFVTAMLFFLAGTALAVVTPVFAGLVAARLLQGVGTGIALPLMFSIVLDQAPFDRMGLMMGAASAITALAPALGPSLGGLVIERWGWRTIFAALLPVMVVALVMGAASIRQVTPIERVPMDWPGWIALSCGFTALILATTTASSAGWTSSRVLGLLAATAVSLALFGLRMRRAANPLIRPGILRSRVFVLSLLMVMLIQFTVLALGYLLPNVGQLSLGAGAFASGCLLLLGCALGVVLAPSSGWLLDRLGPARPILTGNALVLAAVLAMAVVFRHAGMATYLLLYAVFAVGQGLCVPTTITHGYAAVPRGLQTDANAAMNTLQQLAGAVGTAVATTIVAASQRADPVHVAAATTTGAGRVLALLVAIALLALGCSLGSLTSSRGRA
ncbi:MFS transporter [uncultured Bifidobacterium sp.]|uniref:MFS transporter n=1 Tax=uncultured Bifidobacterium sp. TaxID=165187 RepID=UPI0028DB105F|nr:MFS transporter [uncultured Bifidobacterium sp.]